jgi:iron(III) transport system ATP-binding protein
VTPDERTLQVRDVRVRFGSTVALNGFGLDLSSGVILALLGPSGCGKTTALRVIAGLEVPESGQVRLDGRLLTGGRTLVPPERRRIGMVFQEGALFPHLDVWHNVAFGLPNGQGERAAKVIEQVRLTGLERRLPHELSGGQQQRVALARALAPGPEVILLDEPFSNLDASLRASVRGEVRDVLRRAGATALVVTHDQEEALAVADEVAVMDGGRILQSGTPHDLYEAPAGPDVARLLGDANFLPGRVSGGLVATTIGAVPGPGLPDGPVEVMVRPEHVGVDLDPASAAVVIGVEFYGHDQMILVHLPDGTSVRARPLGLRRDLSEGVHVRLAVNGPLQFFSASREAAGANRR